MSRKVLCRERVMRRIVALLEGITTTNGYNTTITDVTRTGGTPQDPNRAPELFVRAGDLEIIDVDGNEDLEEVFPVGVSYSVVASPGQAETEANYIAGDIEKALRTGEYSQITVASSGDDPTVDIEFIGSAVAQSGQQRTKEMVTNISIFEVSFRRMRSDPYRFHSNDTAVTE